MTRQSESTGLASRGPASKTPGSPVRRDCTVCGEPIPAKRLAAIPNATTCVPCLEKQGDVPQIKRFDQATKDGMVEVTFTENSSIERAMKRLNTVAAPDACFEIALGDDSWLTRDQTPREPEYGHDLTEAEEPDSYEAEPICT